MDSGRYLPEWAICCHLNFYTQWANIWPNQQDSATVICQVRMASQNSIYTQNATETWTTHHHQKHPLSWWNLHFQNEWVKTQWNLHFQNAKFAFSKCHFHPQWKWDLHFKNAIFTHSGWNCILILLMCNHFISPTFCVEKSGCKRWVKPCGCKLVGENRWVKIGGWKQAGEN